jgi:ABC-type branched-subunit amino acid transport system permease subunit
VQNGFRPDGSGLRISRFTSTFAAKYLCHAILAISVDLLWCYSGLPSSSPASIGATCRISWCFLADVKPFQH